VLLNDDSSVAILHATPNRAIGNGDNEMRSSTHQASTKVRIARFATICSKAIYHAPSWLSAFGTPGPPLRRRGQIGPLGLLVGVFPIGVFPCHRIKNG
jgi:hypothetical protein